MAFFTGSVFSKALQMDTGLSVVTPRVFSPEEAPFQTVYLLHGLSDNCHDWNQNTQLGLLADTYRLRFVMPEVQRCFYADMAYGPQYFTYITEELPAICKRLFGVSDRREDSYIMGLSMGGYGALKCALTKPERYAGCGAFSAVCDLQGRLDALQDDYSRRESQAIFGMDLKLAPENDLFQLAKTCEKRGVKPNIFMTCGTEDELYAMNRSFWEEIEQLDLPCTYQEWVGAHEWYFWNKSLHLACAHFFQKPAVKDYCNIV